MPTTVTPLSKLAGPKSSVIIKDGAGADRLVDYLDYDNPLWTDLGVLVNATDKAGNVKKTLRMSFQTRKAMGDAMKRNLGL